MAACRFSRCRARKPGGSCGRTAGWNPMNVRFTRSVMALAGAGLVLTGCSSQRSLENVEKSGDQAFETGDYAQAHTDYTEYVDRRPGKARVQHSLGMTYLAQGDAQGAVQCLSVAHDMEPGNAQYTEDMAEALFKTGDRGRLYEFLHRLTEQPGTVEEFIRLGKY